MPRLRVGLSRVGVGSRSNTGKVNIQSYRMRVDMCWVGCYSGQIDSLSHVWSDCGISCMALD